MIGNIGLLLGLAALIFMALRGINILVAALVASLIVAVTNQLGMAETLLEYFPAGPLGAFTFAGQFFILFLTGAIFGKMMSTSGAAASVARAVTNWLGVRRTLLVTVLACGMLTYGGVVLFVVIFTMYPLGIALMREANLPKRLFCGAVALGAGTFTMTALPGTPSIHNVIAASALGTDLFAGIGPGLVAALVMMAGGMAYLEWQWRKARTAGEGYESNQRDVEMEQLAPKMAYGPSWPMALLPLVIVLGTILVPRLSVAVGLVDDGTPWLGSLFAFANAQPVVWPSFALLLGSLFSVLFFATLRERTLEAMGAGANDSVMPLLNTAAVIGFGGVVTQTEGFAGFAQAVIGLDLPPLVSVAASISVVSGIVGSASGGLQIFMQTFAETYLAMGVDAQDLHRIAALASGGLDSLPHSGAVIAMLTIMGLKHREAYRDIFVVTVLIPILATAAGIIFAML
ncbi:GntP family permease [Wenzhouxiangella sp. AB-CW3]|uniref:GntP family permease n=1 Tax=Wenzhouxiangella sp. AB-CW3 TaxID=2771012 RepID=UPI00168A7E1D|nr:GntP family permease [Wenzhouxiangella sp. AB-CW3]QOC23452.1 GntP family permease [Wenzhouxiangella sp. AB-CW3]